MNMLVLPVKGREYILTDFIATELSRKQVEKMKELNPFLKDYKFLTASEIDFSWWSRCFKKLTPTKLRQNCEFEIDYYGHVKEVR